MNCSRALSLLALVPILAVCAALPAHAQTTTLPLTPSAWNLAYSGQDASLTSTTFGSQAALQWQVSSAIGHSDWVYDNLSLPTDTMYTFSVQLAGSGTAALNIWNGEQNVPTAPIQLSSTFQTLTETVSVLSPGPQFQILDPTGTSNLNVYIANATITPAGPAGGLAIWQTAYGGQDSTLTSASYNGMPAFEWQVTAALGHSDWVYSYPPFVPGATYRVSADLAGSGQAAINVYDGNENVPGPTLTLTPDFQTTTETVTLPAPNTVTVSPGTTELQLVDPDTNGSSVLTLYYKNVTYAQVAPPPQPPTGVSARLLPEGGVKVRWDAPAQCSGANLPTITGYNVYIATQPFAETYTSPTTTVSGCGSGATSAIVPHFSDRLAILYATVVATSAQGDSAPSPQVSTIRLTGYPLQLEHEVEQLQTDYSFSNGLFNTTGWWNSANALNSVIDYMERTGSRTWLADVSNTFTKAVNEAPPPTPGNFIDTAYDDTQWWGLTWLNAYTLTGDRDYLHMAETIHAYVTQAWTPSQCGGGLIWQTNINYQNAVTNELFLELSARLYLATHQKTYLQWALEELNWFNASGMINAQHLINDGLTTTCQNNGQTTWTYNQGVILGGLAALYQATGNQAYLTEADQIATAAITTLVNADGILTEPCSDATCSSQNPDQTQFKGVFMRNLYALYQVTGNKAYRAFLDKNAVSILTNDRTLSNQLGFDWSGPVTAPDQSFNASTLTSGLDALNAAHIRWPQPPPASAH